MKYNVGDIIPFEQIQEATDYVNSVDGNYYLEDYQEDEQGRMMLIVRQLIIKPPTEAEIQKMLTDGVQAYMDQKAQERHYDDIFTAISYVKSSDPVFAAEASALLLWRDKVWRLCYTMLDEVKAGVRPIPSVTELLAELPKFEWPEV